MDSEPDIVGNFEDGCLNAMRGSRQAGYIWFVHQDDGSILLSDIHVYDKAFIPPNWLVSWIPGRQPKTACYRNQGAGRALMTTFLGLADEAKVRRIYGSLTADDLAKSPFLKTWYPSFGFTLLPPDHECVPDAAYKIERVARG